MNGTIIIGIGIAFIAAGTALTILGQFKNSQKDIDRLIQQNKMLADIGNSQLKATFYTEELNQEIRNIYLQIHLKEKVKFKDLIPFEFAFEFDPIGEGKFRFRKLIESGEISFNEDEDKKLFVSYKISEISADGTSIISSTSISEATDELIDISIPVYLTEEIEKNKVRDFHDKFFVVYLPDILIKKATSIELIVNGWGILVGDISSAYWGEERVLSWKVLEGNKIKLKMPWSDNSEGSHHVLWLINLYQVIPQKYEEFSSKELTSSSAKNLIFRMR